MELFFCSGLRRGISCFHAAFSSLSDSRNNFAEQYTESYPGAGFSHPAKQSEDDTERTVKIRIIDPVNLIAGLFWLWWKCSFNSALRYCDPAKISVNSLGRINSPSFLE